MHHLVGLSIVLGLVALAWMTGPVGWLLLGALGLYLLSLG